MSDEPQHFLRAVSTAGFSLPGRALRSFHPSTLPLTARPSYARELFATLCLAIAIAPIEGGVIAVFTKRSFAEHIEPWALNLFVAFLGATPELANILSFYWGSLSQGKPKVAFINALQIAVVFAIGLIAFIPVSLAGLILLTLTVLVARVCWSGILTVRPTIWRANYARHIRARIVGKFQAVQVLAVGIIGVALGAALDRTPDAYRLAVPLCAAFGLLAVLTYAKVRVRREDRVLREEAAHPVFKPWQGPRIVWDVLRKDRFWAKFQGSMFLLGFGNLMMTPTIVIVLKEQFNLGYLPSILITTAIASAVMPLSIPLWARFLDRAHVVRFRSYHSWTFVLAAVVMLVGSLTHRVEFFFLAAFLLGIAYGGGSLAWNLGHVDFAAPSDTSRYMATHVTLNGVRGLIAPFCAVFLYNWVASHNLDPAPLVLAVALFLSVAGSLGFVQLRKDMGRLAESIKRGS